MAKQRKAKEIPIREALEIIGKSLFAELWTGKELNQSYVDLFRSYRGQFHNPEIRTFLQSDFNNPILIERLQTAIRDKDFFSPKYTKKKSVQAAEDFPFLNQNSPIARWDKKLTLASMAGTYQRFREAWEILLTSLQDGTIKAFDISDHSEIKDVAREKWHSRNFTYELLTSEIYTKFGHDDDDWIISRCYVATEDVEKVIEECMEQEAFGAGRPGMKNLIEHQLDIRRRDNLMKSTTKEEAKELRDYLQKKIPTLGRIENIINDHLKYPSGKKSHN